jgi:predicted nucleic acid-binding Zn ribbon protein
MENVTLLGEVLGPMVNERLSTRYEQSVKLQQRWNEILPPELAEHCRIEEFSAGVLKVIVDGPGYMHELRLCKEELCGELSAAVLGVKIKDIKLLIGK